MPFSQTKLLKTANVVHVENAQEILAVVLRSNESAESLDISIFALLVRCKACFCSLLGMASHIPPDS